MLKPYCPNCGSSRLQTTWCDDNKGNSGEATECTLCHHIWDEEERDYEEPTISKQIAKDPVLWWATRYRQCKKERDHPGLHCSEVACEL